MDVKTVEDVKKLLINTTINTPGLRWKSLSGINLPEKITHDQYMAEVALMALVHGHDEIFYSFARYPRDDDTQFLCVRILNNRKVVKEKRPIIHCTLRCERYVGYDDDGDHYKHLKFYKGRKLIAVSWWYQDRDRDGDLYERYSFSPLVYMPYIDKRCFVDAAESCGDLEFGNRLWIPFHHDDECPMLGIGW